MSYDFWRDLIDNDTLIIIGVLVIAGFGLPDVQKLVIGGLLGILGNLKK